jgi:hypothetical protein
MSFAVRPLLAANGRTAERCGFPHHVHTYPVIPLFAADE